MDYIEKLLLKKWNNIADTEELEELGDLWLSLTDGERIAYKNLERYWKSEGEGTPKVNQTRLWNRIDGFISEDFNNSEKPKRKFHSLSINKIIGIAASFILLLISTTTYFSTTSGEEIKTVSTSDTPKIIEKVTKPGQKSTLKLPDGSTVVLNSNSKLSVPQKFSKNGRVVTLVGEAYFDISPNKEKPFIVNVDGGQVKVLGTAFNIRSSFNQEKTILNVVEGKVLFSNSDNSLVIKDKEAAIIDLATNKIKSEDYNEDAMAWSKGELVFQASSFEEVISKLENWYGVEIKVERAINLKQGFTGRYNNPSLKDVLIGISFSASFEFEIDGKKVIIK